MPARRPKTLRWDLVVCEWEDAYTLSDQRESEDFSAHKPVVRRTAGFLLYDDEDRVVISGTDDRKTVHILGGEVADTTVIPRSLVRRIHKCTEMVECR